MRCYLCPRGCLVDREKGEIGYCKASNEMVIARYSLHMWEEPVISGTKGSGTIFFSYCNMRCCFCQNYEISELHKGRVVSVEEFSDICLELQDLGAENINLVTPTHYVYLIVDGLRLAKERGLKIPIVYNSSGYERVETVRMLDGLVDVYLPDLKYYSDDLALKYSNCPNYFEFASAAIGEMVRQVGDVVIRDGMMGRGVIVRHLLLPGNLEDSKRIIEWLYSTFRDKIFISIMNQYTPVRKLQYQELNSKVLDVDYEELLDYTYDLGVRNAFVQEGEAADESFIPNFDVFRAI